MGFPALIAAADRAVLNHLGGTVRYAPSVGPAVDVEGVFDASYLKATAGIAGVSGAGPAVFLLLADLPTDPEDDPSPTITVDGQAYKIREVEKDSHGGVVILLHKV